MADFNCIHCSSNRIKLVKAVFKSETEAKYKTQSDFIKSPNIKETLQPDSNVIVTSQSILAKKLGHFELKSEEKWKDFIDLENYNKKQKIKEKHRKYILINKNKILKMYGLLSLVHFSLFALSFYIWLPFLFLFCLISFFILLYWFYYYLVLKAKKQHKESFLFKIRKLEQKIKINSKIIKLILDGVQQLVKHLLNLVQMSEQMVTPRQLSKEIKKFEKEGKKQLKKFNKERFKIWSNLYYCYDCNKVMDLETKLYDSPENINDLVHQISQKQKVKD